jgi:hypothetical protein
MAAPDLISFEPDPPEAGSSLKICYDFDNAGGIDKTRLQVSFNPPVVSTATYDVDRKDNCVTIVLPAGALTILVKDLDGPSADKGGVID